MLDKWQFCRCRGAKMEFGTQRYIEEASTTIKRCAPQTGCVSTRGRGRPKPSPNAALFEREVLAHHVARELFGASAEGMNAIAAEQIDHLLLL